jgi:hypothetical protein
MRTVIHSGEVSQDIDRAAKEFRRLDDCIRALEWRLVRSPEKGVHREGIYWIHRQKGIAALGIPEISVLYSFTDEEVELHAMNIRPAS